MIKKFIQFILLNICLIAGQRAAAQATGISRILTVRDGLPQSYVSGVCQDSRGFLWISTLNGLGRYDGRNFKNFWHTSSDSVGLRSNIILRMLNAGNQQLLLCYSDGRMDLLHTETGKIVPLGGTPSFKAFKPEIAFLRGLIYDGRSICWMVARNGGIFRIDIQHNTLSYFSPSQLGLQERILGIAFQKGQLLLFTAAALQICNQEAKPLRSMAYPFGRLTLLKEATDNNFSPALRSNGDLLLIDAKGLVIWNPSKNTYSKLPLPKKSGPGMQVADSDRSGNYFFEHEGAIYQLKADNNLIEWAPVLSPASHLTIMHIDRSGVLWVGTNGYGLRQYNLSRTGMPGYANKKSFVVDVLGHYGLTAPEVAATFLNNSVPFANRTATGAEGIWIADRYHITQQPELLLLSNGQLASHKFHSDDPVEKNSTYGLQFIAYDRQKNLWGIDQHFRVLKFNTRDHSFHVQAALPFDVSEDINGMVFESEDLVHISSTRHLVRLQLSTRSILDRTADLPSKDLLTIAPDPTDTKTIWIGTLSDGLLRYNSASRKTQVFSMATGLPNNTVYNILPGTDGNLWCSSNKGIFLFQPAKGEVQSFTSRDGLLDDEFNRYYAMRLSDSSLAFGGPLGYTIFKASMVMSDKFDPVVNLTSLSISNLANQEPLSSLQKLSLHYNQNFITAEFAAMQFDAPDKIQYRYMLDGFDKQWIMAGNQPRASYTSLPPGDYTLRLNASNTSGKWSPHILSMRIIISPPFWKTLWFQLLCIATAALLIFLFIHFRIQRIKRSHAQLLQFERQAMDLHAISLRAQMNPHFIFNCLNSIKALIQENQNKNAIRYLTSFVSLIRRQLNNTKNEIPLRDELQTCRLYLELEAMRFDGHIHYHFDIEENGLEGISVPPLTLQPLIENAIIHGLLPKEHGGTVNVRVYRQNNTTVCEIEDDGIGREASARLREKASRLHESKGVELLEKRISLFNQFNKYTTSIQTIDLVDTNGEPSGTLVIIKLNADI